LRAFCTADDPDAVSLSLSSRRIREETTRAKRHGRTSWAHALDDRRTRDEDAQVTGGAAPGAGDV